MREAHRDLRKEIRVPSFGPWLLKGRWSQCKGLRDLGFAKSDFHRRVFNCIWKTPESYLTVAGPGRLGTGPERSDVVRNFEKTRCEIQGN